MGRVPRATQKRVAGAKLFQARAAPMRARRRGEEASPSHTPLDRTNSPSSQRVSGACPDEAIKVRASSLYQPAVGSLNMRFGMESTGVSWRPVYTCLGRTIRGDRHQCPGHPERVREQNRCEGCRVIADLVRPRLIAKSFVPALGRCGKCASCCATAASSPRAKRPSATGCRGF